MSYPSPPPPGWGEYPPPGGYPPPYPPPGGYPLDAYGGYPAPRGTNGLAIASLVCSLVGFACYGVPSLVGVVLGFVSLNQIKQTGQEGKGMALAGIIVGGVIIALYIIGIIIFVVYVSNHPNPSPSHYDRSTF